MNTNKNSYTLIYMVIIITIVSLLLSITSGVLRTRQDENVKLDKKKQILSSLTGLDFSADAAGVYASTIKEYNMLDTEGNTVKNLNPVEDFDYQVQEGELPIYIAEIDGSTKYIIPMNGNGLWGAIWGYIALNEDRNTIYGIYFNHAGETPGLGAEITNKVKFCDPFIGKELIKNGKFASIAVMKVGQKAEGQDQVDAISGGTITSKGVETMLQTSLGKYEKFFLAKEEAVAEVPEAENNEIVEVEPETEGEK